MDIVKYLIEKGADIELESNKKTPLMYAAKYGQLDVVKLLLEKGVDPEKISSKGRTALDYANRGGFEQIVEILKNDK